MAMLVCKHLIVYVNIPIYTMYDNKLSPVDELSVRLLREKADNRNHFHLIAIILALSQPSSKMIPYIVSNSVSMMIPCLFDKNDEI